MRTLYSAAAVCGLSVGAATISLKEYQMTETVVLVVGLVALALGLLGGGVAIYKAWNYVPDFLDPEEWNAFRVWQKLSLDAPKMGDKESFGRWLGTTVAREVGLRKDAESLAAGRKAALDHANRTVSTLEESFEELDADNRDLYQENIRLSNQLKTITEINNDLAHDLSDAHPGEGFTLMSTTTEQRDDSIVIEKRWVQPQNAPWVAEGQTPILDSLFEYPF